MSPPRLVVVAGPNGSGKTTLTRWLKARDIDFGDYINPDDIAAELSGSYEWRVRAAQKIADERRDACIRHERSFSFETVMSHESKIALMRRAREAGFHVTLFFVGTEDPLINISRVANRVALKGHDVPKDLIVARYQRAMSGLWQAASTCNRTFVFDSSREGKGIAFFAEVLSGRPSTKHSHAYNMRSINRGFAAREYPEWIRRFLLAPARSETLLEDAAASPASFTIFTALEKS